MATNFIVNFPVIKHYEVCFLVGLPIHCPSGTFHFFTFSFVSFQKILVKVFLETFGFGLISVLFLSIYFKISLLFI